MTPENVENKLLTLPEDCWLIEEESVIIVIADNEG